MISSDMVVLIAALGTPAVTGISAVFGAWLGRRSTLKQADAAGQTAAATATATVTADWKAHVDSVRETFQVYTDSMMDDRRLLVERLAAVEHRAGAAERRLDAAEERATVSEKRAVKAEWLYRLAVSYMRELVSWAKNLSQVEEIPEPPFELRADL